MSFARKLGAILLIPLFAQSAWGGPADGLGPGRQLLDGVVHPWFGIDHLLATLAIGMLVVHVEKGSIIAVPIVFLSSLMAGAGLHGSGIWLPFGPPVVAISVILLGLALIPGRKYPELVLAVAVALFGIIHGYVHGSDSTASVLPLFFLLGLLVGTTLLLGLGIWIGHWIEPPSRLSRSLGVLVVLGGVGMLVYGIVW